MGNKLFGTDGVRGVANVYPMTAEFALKLGMAAGQLVCRNKTQGRNSQRYPRFRRNAGSSFNRRF